MSDAKNGQEGGKKKPPSAWVAKRPDRRGAPPARLGEVLVGVDDFLAKRSGSAIPRAEWISIVGSRVAGRTRVGKMFKGVLTIKVASSAWSNELSFLKPDLINKLKRAGHDVLDLRFQVDKIADDAPTPKARWGASPRAATSNQVTLPPELEERLKMVEDPNLRAAIAEAARASISIKASK